MDSLERLAIGTTLVIAAGIIMIATDTRHLQQERENVRPHGRTISASVSPDARLTIFKPGPQPFLFYITQDYTIADRPSQIPSDTAYLLLRPEHRGRVFARQSIADRGEPSLIDEIVAQDGKRYQLLLLP